MDIELLLLITHIVGTILGVGGATMIELHLNQALKDKLVSADEGAILGWDYKTVRVGLIMAVLSGFGLIVYHRVVGHFGVMHNPIMWAKLTLVGIMLINTLLLQARMISLYWGTAFSFVSWWTVAIIGVFTTERVRIDLFGGESFLSSFGSIMLIYGIAVVMGAIVLHGIRNKMTSNV